MSAREMPEACPLAFLATATQGEHAELLRRYRAAERNAGEDKRARDTLRAEGAAAERERLRPKLEALAAEIERLSAVVPTESETRAAFEAERARARATERETIRLELVAEADRRSEAYAYEIFGHGPEALRTFARRLEAAK